jgi:hypothetical protein
MIFAQFTAFIGGHGEPASAIETYRIRFVCDTGRCLLSTNPAGGFKILCLFY